MEQKPSIGRIVEFFPGVDTQYQLPNGSQSAPALITQDFGVHQNLTVFACFPGEEKTSFTAWSVPHKSTAMENQFYWDWPARV